jgi:hypothetical protein
VGREIREYVTPTREDVLSTRELILESLPVARAAEPLSERRKCMLKRTLGSFLLLVCIATALPAAAAPRDSRDSFLVRIERLVKRLVPTVLDLSEISYPK